MKKISKNEKKEGGKINKKKKIEINCPLCKSFGKQIKNSTSAGVKHKTCLYCGYKF